MKVVPLDEHVAEHRRAIEFGEWLTDMLRKNDVAVVSVRGIDRHGETFAFDIVPVPDKPTLRYMMIGQLHEAADMLTSAEWSGAGGV